MKYAIFLFLLISHFIPTNIIWAVLFCIKKNWYEKLQNKEQPIRGERGQIRKRDNIWNGEEEKSTRLPIRAVVFCAEKKCICEYNIIPCKFCQFNQLHRMPPHL